MDKIKLFELITDYGDEKYWAGQWEDSDYQDHFVKHEAAADALLDKIKEILQSE